MSPRDATPEAGEVPRLVRIVESGWFQAAVISVIVANAITLGMQTFPDLERDIGGLLDTLDNVFLGIFCAELALRIAAFGRHPHHFFQNGWNVFDFVVVAAAFAPGLRENATLLRLVRLMRVVRIITVLPDLRVLVRGMVASLAPIASMAVLAALLMYVYGIVGWIIFRDEDPEHWANVGEAMLTLFIVMTLESWPEIMGVVRDTHPTAWIFFVSYVLIASFLLINVLIAILINAIEEARAQHRRDEARLALDPGWTPGTDPSGPDPLPPDKVVALEERAIKLREALEELELELGTHARATVAMASKGRMRP